MSRPDKHGKPDTSRPKESETVTTWNCATDGHVWRKVQNRLEQCSRCGGVRGV